MSGPIERLVYYSRNRMVGTPAEVDAEIARILATARRHNLRNDITGALLFNNGCFAQVLEGELSAVEETFERIQQDARHGDVNLLAFGPADGRVFADWSMAYVGNLTTERTRFDRLVGGSAFDPAVVTGEHVLELLLKMLRAEEIAR